MGLEPKLGIPRSLDSAASVPWEVQGQLSQYRDKLRIRHQAISSSPAEIIINICSF